MTPRIRTAAGFPRQVADMELVMDIICQKYPHRDERRRMLGGGRYPPPQWGQLKAMRVIENCLRRRKPYRGERAMSPPKSAA